MQLIVTDRQSIEQGLVVRSAYAVISIRDPGTRRARIRKSSGLVDVLYLAFHDAEPTDAMVLPPEIRVMSQAQARQIVRFVEKQKAGVGTFVVHCHQGMSRSPAIAAALAKYLGLDAGSYWEQYAPNPYVYKLLSDEFEAQAAS